MIVPEKTARAIAQGRQSTLRLPVAARSFKRARLTEGAQRPVDPAPFACGEVVEVKHRERNGDLTTHCWVTVVSVQHNAGLLRLSRTEAKAEGFDGLRGPLDFERAWLACHDTAWQLADLTDEEVAARFLQRWVGTIINIAHLELAEEPARFMAPVGGSTYAASRSIDRDAPMPPRVFVEALAKGASARGEEMRQSFLRELEEERARRKRARVPELRKRAA